MRGNRVPRNMESTGGVVQVAGPSNLLLQHLTGVQVPRLAGPGPICCPPQPHNMPTPNQQCNPQQLPPQHRVLEALNNQQSHHHQQQQQLQLQVFQNRSDSHSQQQLLPQPNLVHYHHNHNHMSQSRNIPPQCRRIGVSHSGGSSIQVSVPPQNNPPPTNMIYRARERRQLPTLHDVDNYAALQLTRYQRAEERMVKLKEEVNCLRTREAVSAQQSEVRENRLQEVEIQFSTFVENAQRERDEMIANQIAELAKKDKDLETKWQRMINAQATKIDEIAICEQNALKELEKMKTSVKDYDTVVFQKKFLKRQLARRNESIHKLTTEKCEVTKKLKATEGKLDQLENERDIGEMDLKNLKEGNSNLERENMELMEAVSGLKNKLSQGAEKLAELYEELKESKRALEEENKSWKKKKENWNGEIKAVRQNLTEALEENGTLEKSHATLHNKVRDAMKNSSNYREAADNLKRENGELEKVKKGLIEDVAHKTAILEKAEEEKERLKEEIATLRDQKQVLKDKCKNFAKINTALQSKYEELAAEKTGLQEQYDKLMGEMVSLKDENTALHVTKLEMGQLQEENDTLKTQLDENEVKLKDQMKNAVDRDEEIASERLALRQEKFLFQNEIEELKEKLASEKKAAGTLAEESKQMKNRNGELQIHVQRLQEENDGWEKKDAELTDLLDNLKKDKEELENRYKKQAEEISGKDVDIESLKRENAFMQEKITEREKEVKRLNSLNEETRLAKMESRQCKENNEALQTVGNGNLRKPERKRKQEDWNVKYITITKEMVHKGPKATIRFSKGDTEEERKIHEALLRQHNIIKPSGTKNLTSAPTKKKLKRLNPI